MFIWVTNKKCCNKNSQFRSEVCIFCQIEQCASQHHPRNENKKQLVKHETSRTLCHNEFSSSTLNLEDAIRDSWNFEVSSLVGIELYKCTRKFLEPYSYGIFESKSHKFLIAPSKIHTACLVIKSQKIIEIVQTLAHLLNGEASARNRSIDHINSPQVLAQYLLPWPK